MSRFRRYAFSVLMLAALAGCGEPQNSSPNHPSIPENRFSYIRTLQRPIRLYAWKMIPPEESTEKLNVDGYLEYLRQGVAWTDDAPLMQKDETLYAAMGRGGYFAFSPSESIFFGTPGYRPGTENYVSLLRSLVVPAGNKYILVSHPEFLRRADELFRKSDCIAKSWVKSYLGSQESKPADGLHGLTGLQGIFRSCPAIKRELVKDEQGNPVTFVVYPERQGLKKNVGCGYDCLLPESRIDDDFASQGKQRWALLTDFPKGSEEEIKNGIRIWAPALNRSAGEEGKPGPTLKSLLHCALEEGSRKPRSQDSVTIAEKLMGSMGASLAGVSDAQSWETAWLSYREAKENASREIGLSEAQNLDEQLLARDFFAFSKFMTLKAEGKSPEQACPSPYEVLHNPHSETARKWQEALGMKPMTQETQAKLSQCPWLPGKLAFGLALTPGLVTLREQTDTDLAILNPPMDLCLPKYQEYLSRTQPLWEKTLEACVGLMHGGGIPSVEIPGSACTPEARHEILSTSYLSQATFAEDLGPDELGEDLFFLFK